MGDRIELRDYLRPKAKMDMIFAIVALVMFLIFKLSISLSGIIMNNFRPSTVLTIICAIGSMFFTVITFVLIGLSLRNIPCTILFAVYGLSFAINELVNCLYFLMNVYRFDISQQIVQNISFLSSFLLFVVTIAYIVLLAIKKIKGIGHILIVVGSSLYILDNILMNLLMPYFYHNMTQEDLVRVHLINSTILNLISCLSHAGWISLIVCSIASNAVVLKTGKIMNKSLYDSHSASDNVMKSRDNYIDTYGIKEHQATHMYVYNDEIYGEYIITKQEEKTYLVKVEMIGDIYYPKDEDMIEIADNGDYQYSTFYTDEDSCLGKKGNMATLIAGLVTFGSVFLLAVLIEGFKIIRYIIDYIN